MENLCRLCGAPDTSFFYQDKKREYFECNHCHLIHVPEKYFLTAEKEKAEYDLHQNDPEDMGYRTFLSKVTKPLVGFLPSDAKGLDFGCGPGPTLSVILEEQGFFVDNYDPMYFPNESLLAKTYQFVTATEVLEHLRQPSQTVGLLWSLVKVGGLLAVMTKQALCAERFANWHYKNDPTHVVFWRRETFDWLIQKLNAEPLYMTNEVVIIRKKTAAKFL